MERDRPHCASSDFLDWFGRMAFMPEHTMTHSIEDQPHAELRNAATTGERASAFQVLSIIGIAPEGVRSVVIDGEAPRLTSPSRPS